MLVQVPHDLLLALSIGMSREIGFDALSQHSRYQAVDNA